MLPLHIHSNYSILESVLPIEKIIEHALANGSSYSVLTDTNGMYGLIKFYKESLAVGLKPIIGTYITDPVNAGINTILIPRTNVGYAGMCKIITSRKLNEEFSLLNLSSQNLKDIFCISSSIEVLEKYSKMNEVANNVFAELIFIPSQLKKTNYLLKYARENKIQVIASHPAYMQSKDDFMLHKVVTSIREKGTLKNISEGKTVDENYHLLTSEEFISKFKVIPESLESIKHIVEHVNIYLGLGENKFVDGESGLQSVHHQELTNIVKTNLKRIYKVYDGAVRDRVNKELDVIDKLCLSKYFLVIWDVVQEAMRRGMMMIGRGSAANSIVCYGLGFSQVDPLKYDFYFERFLNFARKSPPDVDLDFSWKERDEIVKYVYEKHGYDKVAMISTTVTFRARSAFRETAKVFGIPDSEISKFSKFIPWTSAQNLPDIAEKFPETRSLKFDSEPWKTIVKLAARLAGFPRHISIHPSGLVISPKPLTNYVALQYAKNKGLGLIITQPDMYGVEDIGLMKLDLLSQRSLGVLRDTINDIAEEVEERSSLGGESIIKSINDIPNKPPIYGINGNQIA
ncbi:MAG: PHP domain-containing protein [Melioribacteraceae bacterium]|nr:PHP domain-containing protein [Melioribacteraceae bacterium]